MDNNIIEIEIPEEVSTYIEKCHSEVNSRRDILIYLMENEDNINISQNRIKQYEDEYQEKYNLFEKAKRTLERDYIIPVTKEKLINWSLDYFTHIVTVTISNETD